MKALITSLLVSLPAAASAMGMSGGPGCCGRPGAGLVAGAVVAVLGYWVLLQAVKETSTCIKRIGDVLGSILVILGLLGVLCSAAHHVKGVLCRHCSMCVMPQPAPGMGELPAGHPPVEGAPQPAPAPKKDGKAK